MENNHQDHLTKSRLKQLRLSWPVFLALAGILLLAAASLLLGRDPASSDKAGNATRAPRLQVDQELVDFGEVKFKQPVSTTFTLTNTGDETLIFSQVPYIEVLEGC